MVARQRQFGSMAFSTPFEDGAPLANTYTGAFFGWASQVHLEIASLLGHRDAAWLNDLAGQVVQLLQSGPSADDEEWQGLLLQNDPSRSEGTPFPYLVNRSSQLGLFAAREPQWNWNHPSTKAVRWERYAVFAALSMRECLAYLDRIDDFPIQALAYNDAGGYAIEATRALQIAHSLRASMLEGSRRGTAAARARHDAMAHKRATAIEMANSQPFATKRAAIDYIEQNLVQDPVKNTFFSRRAIEEWLKAANWQPAHKRKAG